MSKLIKINDLNIRVTLSQNGDDYVCLTDMAKNKNPDFPAEVVRNWMKTRYTVDFMGIWERIHNINFKLVEFDQFRNETGSNSFILSPEKWIKFTNAIGIRSRAGRYGGTYAHKDIAFEFATWLSPEFKLYLIKEVQRLKNEEGSRLSLEWNLNRTLSKLNYKIHTDAIKAHIIPKLLTNEQASIIYSDEADVLNIALFGITAKQWRNANKGKKGNIRDYASLEQLLVLTNMESINAEFIRLGLSQEKRLKELNLTAINQINSLISNKNTKKLK